MKRSFLFMVFLPALAAAADPGLSIEDLADPQRALSRSKSPANLAALLLEAGENRAVAAFIAALPERSGDLANKLRSQVEFHAGNIAGALQALELVQSPDAWSRGRKKRLQELLALASATTESASSRGTVRVPAEDAFLAQYALPALERAAEKAAEHYGVPLTAPERVEVHADPASFAFAALVPADSLERTGLLTAVRPGRIIVLSPKAVPGGYRWLDAAAGALHRRLASRASGGQAPVWLLEGLARRGEDEWRREGEFTPAPADMNRLAQAALVNPTTGTLLIPFARMEPSLRTFRNQEAVLLAQVQAADAAGFLIEKHGRDRLLALLAALRARPRREAFIAALDRTEEDFEREWIASLEGRSWTIAKGALDRAVSFRDKEPAADAEFQPFLRAGDALAAKGMRREALLQYRKGLAVAPDSGLLLFRAARAAGEDDVAAAEKYLRAASERNPFYVPPFAALGRLLYDDGRYEEAQRVLQEGLELQPFSARLHETLGLISMDVGDLASARRSFQLSLRFDPENADIQRILQNISPKPKPKPKPKGRR